MRIARLIQACQAVCSTGIRTSLALQVRSCSIARTLAVREKIKLKKAEALLGGGQKRIDAQHKKVGLNVNFKQQIAVHTFFLNLIFIHLYPQVAVDG